MIYEKTDCKKCVKQDVCGIKEKYKDAVYGVAYANTTKEKARAE